MERFEITYPIDFRSGGDTTSQAIGKHREEIKKIYGHLNLLDSESLSGDEIKNIVSGITNNLTFENIKGTLDGSRITGTLTNAKVPAANVYGKLTNATIDAGKVDGLKGYVDDAVKKLIPDDRGDGITSDNLNQNGYVEFGNGFMIQWGVTDEITGSDEKEHRYEFAKSFKHVCAAVNLTLTVERANTGDFVAHLISFDTSGFSMTRNSFPYNSSGTTRTHFMAFGW